MKLFEIEKNQAEKILRGFLAKYEKKYQGIFAVSYLEGSSISINVLATPDLHKIQTKDILSMYLIAVRSQKHFNKPISYHELAFNGPDLISNKSQWKMTADPPKVLSNSDSVNNPLKRSAPANDENSKDTISKPTSKVLTAPSMQTAKIPASVAPSEKTSQQPSKNLFNFFGKK